MLLFSGLIIKMIINPKIENILFNEEMENEFKKRTPNIASIYLLEKPDNTKSFLII